MKIDIILEQIIKSINILTIIIFIYTIWIDWQKKELEKKSFWYRECIAKPIMHYLEELENELENFLDNKKLTKNMKIIKDKIYTLRKKIKVFYFFSNEKEKIINRIEEHIENMENNIFNITKKTSQSEIAVFLNKIRREVYLYEKSGYKDKNKN